jgi:adenylate kinase
LKDYFDRKAGALKRMLIVGAPGSGKGTQAARIAAHFGILHVSTGDLFRLNFRNRTELGVAAQKYLNNGDLVPDSITNAMVRERLQNEDVHHGFLLDGYPRTAEQVTELDDILAGSGRELDVVLHLTADDDELIRRLLLRAEDEGRSDDNLDVIRRRLDLYRLETEAVLDLYALRGILVSVDGAATVDEVTANLLAAADTAAPQPAR